MIATMRRGAWKMKLRTRDGNGVLAVTGNERRREMMAIGGDEHQFGLCERCG